MPTSGPRLIPVSGVRIAKARTARRLSVNTLADRVGMGADELSEMENLVADGVAAEVLVALALELRVDVAELMLSRSK